MDCILVDYDWTEKVHRLNIHFKIPVFHGGGGDKYSRNIGIPSETPINSDDQLVPVENYSTVTGTPPTVNGPSGIKSNNISTPNPDYNLRLDVQMVSSNLWTSTYSPYQQKIFDSIRKLHEEDGWNFKQISVWLNDNGYLSPRGKVFRENHVWSIYVKKLRSIERFGREFPHVIKDVKVDVVDYLPSV